MRELNQLSPDEEEIREMALAYLMARKQSSNPNSLKNHCSNCGKIKDVLYSCQYGFVFKCKAKLCESCVRIGRNNKVYCPTHFLKIQGQNIL